VTAGVCHAGSSRSPSILGAWAAQRQTASRVTGGSSPRTTGVARVGTARVRRMSDFRTGRAWVMDVVPLVSGRSVGFGPEHNAATRAGQPSDAGTGQH